jgi:hypothetical protein
MKVELRVYVLRFADVGPLTRAFDRIVDAPEVASCSLEIPQRQLRMLAPPSVAERLVERLYLEGGLSWCSRHAFDAEPPPS